MEPFVQRMLERAKARREKLNEQLINAGHDIKKSPSKGNVQLEQLTVAAAAAVVNEISVKSPKTTTITNEISIKSPKATAAKTPIKSSDIFLQPENGTSENNEQNNKENDEFGTYNVRSKLQRLGKLYSEDNTLGSPIHRTEEKFNAEEIDTEHKPIKRGARLDRLAALASTINNWEDDLSHPILNSKAKPVSNKTEKIQAKFNEQVKNVEPQPSTSENYKWVAVSNGTKSKDASPVKQLKWDKTVLENLEAQGFSRTKSNSRLVYDYKHCSQGSTNATPNHLSPKKLTSNVQMEKKRISSEKFDCSPRNKNTEDNTSNSNTPENIVKGANTNSSSRLPSRTGFNGSPKTLVQSSGSVLSKASMFEAKNMDTKAKDPTQMSVAERMAFFERNKGEAPLIPKAPLTMSIPPKKLQESNKFNMQSGSNISNLVVHDANNRNETSNKSFSVLEQRAVFEQGSNKNKVGEMENHILQATNERQRELNMLRSRFNNNKEIARAAAGSCVRTSESSEGGGKSTSPKSSPICPVKPTPAPDHITPPPPPPLPPTQPEIVSYHSKSSIKRQVVGSPPKVQHSNKTFSDSNVKRIRVCIPKTGSLYPNLSNIEVTEESEVDSEYTIDSTEPVTATLDEKTETESETTTEADYYIQNNETDQETESDRESTQNSSFGRTSLGRTVLNAFNERSLFNKKRSIEPDPDSTTSDISALDEMDQYLDECLDMEDNNVKEEGPTPPKVNKGGRSPLVTHNSFKYRSPLKDSLEDGGKCKPLVRTVSAYRREQSQLTKAHSASKPEAGSDLASDIQKCEDESVLVENKVKKLLDEVVTQNKKIEEASKALNLCKASIEFNGSSEHVGGEWALLVATRKRQAALNEVQRLKREGTLRPVKAGSPDVGSGALSISAITLSLKPEYIRHMGLDKYLHCVCLMYHLGEMVATQAATAEPGDSCIRFTSMLKFENLYSDFKIDVEVYSLQTQPKFLPHEKKYHINHHNIKTTNKTPKKKSQFVMPDIQSPAGPHVIRSPAFELSGTATITINDINCEQFTLYGVSPHAPLEGLLRMRVSRKLSVSIEHRGFLTLFEDISNLGAWRRRWCWLKDARLYFWIHPEDEHKKSPISYLDLEGVITKNVQFVNREKCARPYTFVLETSRPAQPGDDNSLIMKTNGIETTIQHFLLADTKEEGLQWMSKLNKTLSLIRAWGLFRNPV
ncbi:anillin-like isoform X1 [Camponotus floridanus]|uniref:anillin-like isoform X1 n=1 Tax=Camponotus floridanus TaxID=104421 RepID=UPI000DC678E7|nr:anillin-like isoform X1 [Camponotus floridanus]